MALVSPPRLGALSRRATPVSVRATGAPGSRSALRLGCASGFVDRFVPLDVAFSVLSRGLVTCQWSRRFLGIQGLVRPLVTHCRWIVRRTLLGLYWRRRTLRRSGLPCIGVRARGSVYPPQGAAHPQPDQQGGLRPASFDTTPVASVSNPRRYSAPAVNGQLDRKSPIRPATSTTSIPVPHPVSTTG